MVSSAGASSCRSWSIVCSAWSFLSRICRSCTVAEVCGCRVKEAREIGKGSAPNYKNQRQSTSHRRTKLAAGIEHQPCSSPARTTPQAQGLLFAQTHGQLLIKVRRRLRRLPRVEQCERCLK